MFTTDQPETVSELSETDAMLRHINRELMVTWINRDLINRANYDVRKSYVFYDQDKMFEFALSELPSQGILDTLVREAGIHFWSRGIV